MTLGLVWAQARRGAIGLDGTMPWHIPEDSAHFKTLTGSSPVIMGRRTWDSLPPRFRPLPGRRNVVITSRSDWQPGDAAAPSVTVVHSVDEALALTAGSDAWVIGGGTIYSAAMDRADVLEVTEIDADVEGDTYAPVIPAGWRRASVEPEHDWHTSRAGLRYRFVRYEPDSTEKRAATHL